jgi:hypothetical protein
MAKKATREEADLPKPLPEPSGREKSAIHDSKERVKNRRLRFSLKVHKREGSNQIAEVGPPHSDFAGWGDRLRDAFGTTSFDFAASELSKLANALTPRTGAISEETENAILAVIDGARPRDEVEAMLVGQMAVTHTFALELLGRAKRVEEIQQFDSAGNMAVKLLRTFTMQIEALAKLRRGGEQTVRVEHVHVYPGGQAVVGNVTATNVPGGGGGEKNAEQAHAPTAPGAVGFAPCTPVWSADAEREALPIASGTGKEAVPNARRRKG